MWRLLNLLRSDCLYYIIKILISKNNLAFTILSLICFYIKHTFLRQYVYDSFNVH